MDLNITGKVAIIGGSSKGLGKACAVALAKEGVNIVLCARNEDTLHEAQREIEALGVPVHLYLHVKQLENWAEDKEIFEEIGLDWVR